MASTRTLLSLGLGRAPLFSSSSSSLLFASSLSSSLWVPQNQLHQQNFHTSQAVFEEEQEETQEEQQTEEHPKHILRDKYLAELEENGSLSKRKLKILKKIIRPYPSPPEGLTVDRFLWKIGKDCYEHREAFEGDFRNLMYFTGADMKEKEIPIKQRRWILKQQEHYRAGLMDMRMLDPAQDQQCHVGSQPPQEDE